MSYKGQESERYRDRWKARTVHRSPQKASALPSHGGNTGSNPVGDAIYFNNLPRKAATGVPEVSRLHSLREPGEPPKLARRHPSERGRSFRPIGDLIGALVKVMQIATGEPKHRCPRHRSISRMP